MGTAAKIALFFSMVAVALAGALLERDLGRNHVKRQNQTREAAFLIEAPLERRALPPVPPTAPDGGRVPKEPRVYVVKEGDTLGRIASRELGSTKGWKAILRLNEDVLERPEAVRLGMHLKLPGPSWREWLERAEGRPAQRAAEEAAAADPNAYVIVPGDSLGKIAQKTLGSVRFAGTILKANADRIDDPDRLKVGTVLSIPR